MTDRIVSDVVEDIVKKIEKNAEEASVECGFVYGSDGETYMECEGCGRVWDGQAQCMCDGYPDDSESEVTPIVERSETPLWGDSSCLERKPSFEPLERSLSFEIAKKEKELEELKRRKRERTLSFEILEDIVKEPFDNSDVSEVFSLTEDNLVSVGLEGGKRKRCDSTESVCGDTPYNSPKKFKPVMIGDNTVQI